jgi:hypothetical protein
MPRRSFLRRGTTSPTRWGDTVGAQLRFGTAGATGGGFSAQPGRLQPSYAEDNHEPRWSWQARSPKTWKDPNRWYSLWSFGCRVNGGNGSGQDGAAPIGHDMQSADLYEPYSCDGPGTSVSRFIRGVCQDESSVAVANAIVQGFRTSDDFFVGQVQANTDGTYTLATDTIAGTQHYLVAYKPGSPDIAGTTVNTITNTLVDGT